MKQLDLINEAVDIALVQIGKLTITDLKNTLPEDELTIILEGCKELRKVIYPLLAEYPNNKGLNNLKNILSQISV